MRSHLQKIKYILNEYENNKKGTGFVLRFHFAEIYKKNLFETLDSSKLLVL